MKATRRSALALAALLWGLLSFAGYAQDDDTASEIGPELLERAAPDPDKRLRQQSAAFFRARTAEQRLQDLGWILATANARFCEDAPLSIGLRIQDARAFGNPRLVRRIVGSPQDFTVRTVARGSPADNAGIGPHQSVLAVDDQRLSAWPFQPERSWARYGRAHDAIASSLARDGQVTLLLEGSVARTVKGIPACATIFEMQAQTDVAMADGMRVRFGQSFPAFDYPRDEFAAIIAHEFAHNLLEHPQWLSQERRSTKRVRRTEREADRLIPWLLANAGFEPEAALRFMERWGPQTQSGLLRPRTHESWKKRMKTIAEEISFVRQAIEQDGYADWKSRFRREIDR